MNNNFTLLVKDKTMCSVLENVVKLGGLSLQAEDCLIRAAVSQRNEHGGLDRIQNERYHQFLIWRAVLPLFDATIEREGNTDLIIKSAEESHYFEMKNWRSVNGERELPSIRDDIKKLGGRDNGYILITSANPPGKFSCNIKFLLENLNGLGNRDPKHYLFNTISTTGCEIEYWIAGWPLPRVKVEAYPP
ncbi:hypothetical protein [Acidocella sp.]|uniref:hypothetical protein n=1 Tax=Acidocella sp. TaxID=50710 RepID=UPI00183BDE97|nr:hypothetical protein [Acidocella sp.]NNM56107.1 hypothetical protein [Acidocella sp.]